MSDLYESPLVGYENAPSLPDKINADGKSLYSPPGPRSAAYEEFCKPIDSSNNGFDFHSECSAWSVLIGYRRWKLKLVCSLLHAVLIRGDAVRTRAA